ncbi:type VI secretion system ATPase TssH [Variovorax sp. H27-G14]|uniref:type VI secretion system ATPase TssH n=1 Tax=Variovorax sp. H27-G14 TaxID=3111914 RepID=UPI0038FCBBD4
MTVARRALFGELNLTLFKSIESATAFARLSGNPCVELVYWLHQLWQRNDSDLQRICRHYNLDSHAIAQDMASALASLPSGATSLSDFSRHIEVAIERACALSRLEFEDHCVRSAWLLVALLQTAELRCMLLAISPAFQRIPADHLGDVVRAIIADSPEQHEEAHDGSGLRSALAGEASGAISGTVAGPSSLARYCTDLTERALSGHIGPVIGRAHEIRTMADILLRRRQNNPLLTGAVSVGKTAVVEGLALAIVNGEVPPSLRGVRLLSLNVGALLAGTSMRGEFESRLKSFLDEASKPAQPVILFIDEVHSLLAAGGQSGTGDAVGLLKSALASGTLRTVGATTRSEYKRHIENDPALARLFQPLHVADPEEAAAIEIVGGLVTKLAAHHGVTVLDEAVKAAVRLSHRYIPAQQFPDKAISLIDAACARVAMSLHTPPSAVARFRAQTAALQSELDLLVKEHPVMRSTNSREKAVLAAKVKLVAVTGEPASHEARWREELAAAAQIHALRRSEGERQKSAAEEAGCAGGMPLLVQPIALKPGLLARQKDAPSTFAQVDEYVVAAIVAEWTGIPVDQIVRNEVATFFNLQSRLEERVIGQSIALSAIAERMHLARTRLADLHKPVGVFLLVGPSGVGKTETALALAQVMYDGEQNLVTIDMGKFQEPHTVSTLKGSRAGGVGYGEGAVLTEAVRRNPYSVILLDEIEKAHPDVHQIFFQVFDKGWMEDGDGRHIDFRNTTILLTSNTGAELIERLRKDVALIPNLEVLCEALQPILRTVFSAAFLGCLSVVPYLPLGARALADIVVMHLDRVVDRMKEQHGIELVYAPAVVTEVIARCTTHETGARRVLGFIEQKLLPILSRQWLDALHERRTITRMSIDVQVCSLPGQDLQGGLPIVCHTEYA